MLLESASEECNEMHHDLYDDSILPDKDSIYSSSEEMRRFAERLNTLADRLMAEYNNMDHHQYMLDLDYLRSESYVN
jgi:hypothetical protein